MSSTSFSNSSKTMGNHPNHNNREQKLLNSKGRGHNKKRGHKNSKERSMIQKNDKSNNNNKHKNNNIHDIGDIEQSFERMNISSKQENNIVTETIPLPKEMLDDSSQRKIYKHQIEEFVSNTLLNQKTNKDAKENNNHRGKNISRCFTVRVEGLVMTLSGPNHYVVRNAARKIRDALRVEGGIRWLKGELGWEWSRRLENSSSRKQYLDALNKLQDVFAKLAPPDVQKKFPRDAENKKLIWVKESDLASSVASVRSFLELLFYLDDVNSGSDSSSSSYPMALIKNVNNPTVRWNNIIMAQVKKLMRTGTPDAPVHFSVHHQNNRYPLCIVTPEGMEELVGRLTIILKHVFLGYPPKKNANTKKTTVTTTLVGVGTAWYQSEKRESDWKHNEENNNNNNNGTSGNHSCSNLLRGFETPESLQRLLDDRSDKVIL